MKLQLEELKKFLVFLQKHEIQNTLILCKKALQHLLNDKQK
jgi:hypothetical protein